MNSSLRKKIEVKKKHHRSLTDEEYGIARAERNLKIDTILDKISQRGMESLTVSEKKFLNSNSI